jgi:PAS domain S-box-containing protein
MSRVLVVDDKPESLHTLTTVLTGLGYEVETARNGTQALALARSHPPRMVVSDLFVPATEGDTLLRHWKSDERLASVPFVVYTARHTGPGDERLALNLGADAFIVTPEEPDVLAARLRDVFERVESGRTKVRFGEMPERALKEHNEILVRQLEEKALQLQQANAALRKTTELMKQAQRLANVGSWVWHVKLGKVEWSEQVYRIFGIAPETFDGDLNDAVSRVVHPDDRGKVEEVFHDIAEGRPPRPIEYRVIWRNGTECVVWTEAGEEVRDDVGRLEQLCGIVQDITAQRRVEEDLRRSLAELALSRRALLSLLEDEKRAEAEVRRLNAELEQRVQDRTAQLEEANRELDAFSHSVSHDLRAPLRAIDGFAQILVEDYGPALDAEGQRLCAVVSESARDMGRLIDDLLSLARVGRAAVKPTVVDMGRMAAQVSAELVSPNDRSRLRFQLGDLPAAEADPALIRLVWRNLIENAVKFTSKRDHAVIEVGAVREGREVVYFVRDNGAGFDMQYAGRLFGVFQRLHSSEDFEGTGVGLAIVQRIVHRHGGWVRAEGRPGAGATFYFTCAPGGRP